MNFTTTLGLSKLADLFSVTMGWATSLQHQRNKPLQGCICALYKAKPTSLHGSAITTITVAVHHSDTMQLLLSVVVCGALIPMGQGGHVPSNIYEGGDVHGNVPQYFRSDVV